MLKEVGLGIAMGNSPDALKLAADQVTLSNEEDGLYVALKELSFKKGGSLRQVQ
jgi:hydroxymethylpyrimidine pyrophosphatase-like HAD family hydrolase